MCIEMCSGQALTPGPSGVPAFDREKCVHCGACIWNCAASLEDDPRPRQHRVHGRRRRPALRARTKCWPRRTWLCFILLIRDHYSALLGTKLYRNPFSAIPRLRLGEPELVAASSISARTSVQRNIAGSSVFSMIGTPASYSRRTG